MTGWDGDGPLIISEDKMKIFIPPFCLNAKVIGVIPYLVLLSLLALPVMGDETISLLKVGNDVYTNVTVTKVTATDIFFTASGGMGNAKLKNLDAELQKHFNYDPIAGDAMEKAVMEAGSHYTGWLMTQPILRPPDMTKIPEIPDREPEIVGSARFSNQVSHAMHILASKDANAYEVAEHYIGRIREGEHSGMWAFTTPATFELTDQSAYTSLTWCAAVIAHDSFHSKLYKDYLKTHDGPVPADVWSGLKAEQQCMEYQLRVMEKIGATQREIDWAKKQADGHYAKKEGTWEDYTNRNW